MQNELKRIQQAMEITFVYVTHDQEEALAMSDTVVVMDGGQPPLLLAAGELADTPLVKALQVDDLQHLQNTLVYFLLRQLDFFSVLTFPQKSSIIFPAIYS